MKIFSDKTKKMAALIFLLLVAAPLFASAQFVVCGDIAKGQEECSYKHLFLLFNNIIDWIIKISIPVAAGVFAWAGFLYMTTGVADNKNKAKKMLQNVFIGFVVILSAWIIVNTITNALLKKEFRDAVPVEGTNKNN